MSQQMNILCCCSCSMYQVHIVKKAKKWQCKICNTKQTFRQIFFQGSGKDCRIQVQKLNAMKEYENQSHTSFETANNTYDSEQNDYTEEPRLEVPENKWAKYLDTSDEGLFNTVQTSDYQEDNKTTDDSLDLYNDNASHGCSQNLSHSFHHNASQQDSSYNDEKESNNLVEQEIYYVASDAENDSERDNSKDKNVTKAVDTKSIFDDNEDFDLAIDF
ncbi:MRN complex-interacting protein [Augochlora pura]